MVLKSLLRAINLVVGVLLLTSVVQAQQTVNCYPQNLANWTGTCTSSAKTQSSFVYAYANFPPSNPNVNSNSRGWMKFDVSAIPDGSTINEVKIRYFISAQNNPFYYITKLALDPVTAGASTIYNAIGLANSATSTNTYFHWNGAATSGWNIRTLNNYGKTDLQAALPADYFCVGFYEYESGSYYFQAHGWNQLNKPYLEVTYTPNFSNDIGIVEFVTPLAQTCQGQDSVRINIRNYGINTITTATIAWSINGISQTNYIFNGNLAPGAIKTIALAKYTFNPGNITFFAQATGPNNTSDPNPSNNSKLHIVQVTAIPVIFTQPTDETTTIGGNATFSLLASGAGIAYQWQQSTDNGLSFTNLSNTAPYSGVATKDMTVTNAQSSMTGYLYRCYISGTCPPDIITDTVMLIVGDPIHLTAAVAYACPGQSATVPLTIQNMNNIQNFKITLSYNNLGVTYVNTTNINPALSAGTWLPPVVAGGLITLQWNSSTPVSIANGTLCNLNFTYNTADSPLNFTTSVANSCYFTTPTGIKFPTNYTSGAVNNANGTILNQPQNFFAGMGGTAIFSVTTTGAPNFQWQYSINGGTSWANVPSVAPYSGGQTSQLTITNCTLAMNNYKFRVIVSGCSNTVTSNEAILNVIKIVKTKVYHYTKCQNDLVIVPIRVWNFDSIGSISLTLNYDQTVLQWVGTQNLAPGMGVVAINNVPGAPAKIRVASYTLTNISIPDSGIMVELKFNFLGGCTQLTWDTINQGFCEYSDVMLNAIPGIFTSGSVCDAKPVVATQPPASITIFANQNTSIGITATGTGTLTYQWQFLSTAGGAVWTSCPAAAPYSGVLTPTLTITGVPLAYAGYQYRCIVSGMCTPATSNITLLNVNPPPIYCYPGNVTACAQDTVFIPINVDNCNGIRSFKLKLRFDNTLLTYHSFKQLNSSLLVPANFTVTISGDTAIINWFSSSVSNLGSGILVKLKFIANGMFCNSPLTWPANKSYFKNASGTDMSTSFTNGDVCIAELPVSFNIITPAPANGHYCQGGTGVQIGLDNSQTGVNYVLYMNGSLYNPATTAAGTGGGLALGTFANVGIYTILAVSQANTCTKFMDGEINVVTDSPPSLFTLSGSGSFCTGGSGIPVTLSGSQTGVTYQLILSGSAVSSLAGTGSSLSFGNITTPGVYTVKGIYDATGTCPTTMTGTSTITENFFPANAGTISGNTTICQSQNNITYTIPSIQYASSYLWTVPSGASIVSGQGTNSIVVNYGTSAVSGNITVKGQNSCGDGSVATLPVTLSPLPGPAGAITGTNPVCQGQSNVQFCVPVIDNASTYIWTTPLGATGTSNTNCITLNFGTSAISGNITVKGQNVCGAGSTYTFPLIVNPLPSGATAISGQTTVCQGAPILFSTGTISNASSYTWTLPSGATGTSTSNSITVTFMPPGGNLQVTGTNSCGNGNPYIIPISVNPKPVQPGTIVGSPVVCQNQNNVLFSVPPVTFASSGYVWTFPAGATIISGANTNGVTVNFGASAISGTVTVAGNNSCGLGPVSNYTLTVNNLPVVSLANFSNVCQEAGIIALTGGSPAGGTYSGPGVSANAFNPVTAGLGTVNITYTYTSAQSCTNSATKPVTVVFKPELSGYVAYDNVAATKMGGELVKLLNTSGTVLTTTTSAAGTGNYYFYCLENGSYNLEATTTRPWTSEQVNSADALFVAQYAVSMAPGSLMSDFRKEAADVNNNGNINATDALLIMKRWIGTVSYFAAGDWVFDVGTTNTINNADVTQNIRCLKVGDANASYLPAKQTPVGFEKSGRIYVDDFSRNLVIPVTTKTNLTAAALSLAIEFPYESIDILDVQSNMNGLLWNVVNGQIRIAWYDLNARSFKAGDVLFNIIARLDKGVNEDFLINFSFTSESELTDIRTMPIEEVVLRMPEVKISQEIQATEGEIYLKPNVPNPFNGITDIEYSLPSEGIVRLSIYNLTGEEIEILVDQKQAGGIYNIKFDGSKYSPGVYLYKLQVSGPDHEFIGTRTMVIQE